MLVADNAKMKQICIINPLTVFLLVLGLVNHLENLRLGHWSISYGVITTSTHL